MTATQETSTVWLCGCCIVLLANGEDTCEYPALHAPLSLIYGDESITSITLGVTLEEHECDYEQDWHTGKCWCEHIDFTWSACDGCGDTGGSRDAATIWFKR